MKAVFPALCSFIFVLFSCVPRETSNPLERALASTDYRIKNVMDSLERYEVQIKYSQIDRENDSIVFTDYNFQVNEAAYFYPASTVKFAAAVSALEKLNELDSLHRDSHFFVAGDTVQTTFTRAIQEIFAVSDNAANNRLVEFLGQDDINKRMDRKGVSPIRISHRLSTANADDVTTKPLIIFKNDSTTVNSLPIINKEPQKLQLLGIEKGTGFYAEDSLYQHPFDFSLKNYFPIAAQHELLKRVIFPNTFPVEERFNLTKDQYGFLRNAMHTLPRDTGYDPEEYYDGYCKFFLYGDSTDAIPEHMEIYNKVGYAYGTLTDCAYIKDTKNAVEFMLTATILVNKDGIFNDDHYEYDDVGIPFLAELGRALYAIELERK